MRNLTLGPSHGGGDRGSHRRHVEGRSAGLLGGGLRRHRIAAVLHIGQNDRTAWSCPVKHSKVEVRRHGCAARSGRSAHARLLPCEGRNSFHGHVPGRRGSLRRFCRHSDRSQVRSGDFRGLGFHRRLSFAPDHGKRTADRNLHSDFDQIAVENAVLERLDLDRALLGLHDRDDITMSDLVAGLLFPLDQRTGFHVGTKRRHDERSHRQCLCIVFRAAATMRSVCGIDASSRCRA